MSGSRALVVLPNWVGDTVMAEPVVRALVDSGRELVLLARPHLAPLAALLRGDAEIVVRDDDATTVGRLRSAGCDEAFVLPNSFRSARLVRAAGIARRYGYRGDFRGPLLAPAVARPRRRRPQVEDYGELLAAGGVAAPASWVPRIQLPGELRARGRERLERARIEAGARPLVGLFPGAEWGASKRWPWRRFAELSHELRRRWPGSRQIVVAGPKEVWLAVRMHEEGGRLHPVIGPDLDLPGLAAVLGELDLLITNDSGPMHLAAALGVPTVALFGPTDPRRTAPAGDGHAVLWRDLWCSPCFRRRCPLLHHGCLRGISATEVAEAAAPLLERAAARRAPLRRDAAPRTLAGESEGG